MWRLSIFASISTMVMIQSASPAVGSTGEADAIVMFGAHWCAPCLDEIRHLPDLVAAARPKRIVLAWIDQPLAPVSIPTGIVSVPPDVARRWARALASDGYGLPFSVMFDAHGGACAMWRAPLDTAAIADMRRQCVPGAMGGQHSG